MTKTEIRQAFKQSGRYVPAGFYKAVVGYEDLLTREWIANLTRRLYKNELDRTFRAPVHKVIKWELSTLVLEALEEMGA